MKILKQSTAVTIVLGPFVDNADGYTPETGLTITQAEVRLSKNGTAFAQKDQTSSLTAMETNGYYSCQLNGNDTDSLGKLIVAINETGALPVWNEYDIVPAMIYDALILGTDVLQSDLIQIDGLATLTSAAILRLKHLLVDNTTDDGLAAIHCTGKSGGGYFGATSATYNYAGLQTFGSGTSAGMDNQSSGTGPGMRNLGKVSSAGMRNQGGNTSGVGLENVGTNEVGQRNTGGINKSGLDNVGQGIGHGQNNIAGASGSGMKNEGGTLYGMENTGRYGMKNYGSYAGLINEATSGSYPGLQNLGSGDGAGTKNQGGAGNSHGFENIGVGTGRDIYAKEIGSAVAIDGLTNAGILEVLKKFADDNSGADFDATTDSLHKIAISGTGLTAQQIRDSLKLAPSGGAPAAGSVDAELDTLQTGVANAIVDIAAVDVDTTAIVAKLPAGTISDYDPAIETVDGITHNAIHELALAMVNGRFRKDFPASGQVTFYKRDNVSVLFTVNVSTTERTRV